jgi:hypothetical protein
MRLVDGRKPEPGVTDRVREILLPYGSGFTGTIARGDVVVPQREVPKLLREIAEAALVAGGGEVGDRELFDALTEASRRSSVQDQVAYLRTRFRITPRLG